MNSNVVMILMFCIAIAVGIDSIIISCTNRSVEKGSGKSNEYYV